MTANSLYSNFIDAADSGGNIKNDVANLDYIKTLAGGIIRYDLYNELNSGAVYPMIGGTEFSHKFNFMNPVDSDAARRIQFFNSPTHDVNGVLFNGTTQYANTFLNPTSAFANPKTDISLSYYRTGGTGLGATFPTTMGAQGNNNSDNNNYETILGSRTTISFFVTAGEGFPSNVVQITTPLENSYTLGTTKSGTANLFKKGIKCASSIPSASGFAGNCNIFLGNSCINTNTPSPVGYQNIRLGFSHVGLGLTDIKSERLSHLIYTMQGIKARQ